MAADSRALLTKGSMGRRVRLALALRDGTWVDRARVIRVCVLLLVAHLALWGYLLAGEGTRDPLGRPIAPDFSFLYAGSRAIQGGAAVSLYDFQRAQELVRDVTGSSVYAWFYPPAAFFLFYPLAWAPYLASLAGWLLASIGAFVLAIRAIVGHRLAILAAVAFPAVHVAASHGQGTILAAAAFGGFLVLLPTSPAAAGALLAVASARPHTFVLIPLALVVGRQWVALAAATLAVALPSALATAVFGVGVWPAFLEAIQLAGGPAVAHGIPAFKLCSTYGALRLLGADAPVAIAAQAATAAASALAVAWLWSREIPFELRAAGLAVAGLLVSPYLFDYDLVVVGVAIALLARFGWRAGWLPWEKTALAVAWAIPIVARPLAVATHLSVAPIVLAGLLVAIVRRARAGRQAVARQ